MKSESILYRRRVARVVAALGAAAALGIAAGGASATPQDEQAVRKRAEQRWQALIAGKFEDAWAMHSPGWRAVNPYADWRSSMGTSIKWLAARSTQAVCEGTPAERCTVSMMITSQPVAIKDVPRETGLIEAWVRSGGQWWHVPVVVKAPESAIPRQ
jgi:hypothetical protein